MATRARQSQQGKAVAQTVAAALQPADIILTVHRSGFKDVLMSTADRGKRGTLHTMTLLGDHPRVKVKTSASGRTTKLIVLRGGAILRFKIESQDSDNKYFPLGIAFVRRRKSRNIDCSRDTLGRENFSFDSMRLSDSDESLTVTDRYNDPGPADRYKFSVIIQRERDGQIGIIDPPIEHEH